MYNAVRVMPVLLLSEDGLVKTIKFKDRKYIGDPINTIRIFNEKQVDELVILDIDATKTERINFDLISDMVSEAFMPVAYGGGVKNLEEIKKLIRIGIEKIIINSAFYNDFSFVKKAVEYFGSQAIVGCIDVKKGIWGSYLLYSKNGTKKLQIKLEEHIEKLLKLGIGEIIINDIGRDGTMKGYDVELVKYVTNLVSIPVTICGGAGSLDDLLQVKNSTNISGLAVGSLFIYHGKHNAVLMNYLNPSDLRKFER